MNLLITQEKKQARNEEAKELRAIEGNGKKQNNYTEYNTKLKTNKDYLW